MSKEQAKARKAFFSQRLAAFILDIIMVSVISTLITAFIPVSDATDKLYQEQTAIMDHYIKGKADMEEYVNQMVDISYDISRETGVVTICSLVISLLYFVVYPVYHNGQTFGKKLLKIRVQKTNDKELTMNDLLFRSMINNSILVNLLSLCLVFFTTKNIYLNISTILTAIQYLILIVSALMVAFTKSRQGIHDRLVKTEVVLIEPVKEEVICEN